MHEVQAVQKEEDVVEAEAEARGEKEDDGGGQSRVLHFLVCSLAHPVLGRSFCMNFDDLLSILTTCEFQSIFF